MVKPPNVLRLTGRISLCLFLSFLAYKVGAYFWNVGYWMSLFSHNETRLAPLFAWVHGYPLYSSTTGPVLNTIYGPMAYLSYFPTLFAPSIESSIRLGCVLSALFILLPLCWIYADIARERHAWAESITLLLATAFFIAWSSALRYSTFTIHSDAPALGWATLGVFLAARSGPLAPTRYWMSALCVTFALWTKQTLFPLLLILPLYVYWVDRAESRAYIRRLGVLVASFSLLFFILFSPSRMGFNFMLLTKHSWRIRPSDLVSVYFIELWKDYLGIVFWFLIAWIAIFLVWRSRVPRGSLLFFGIGVFMIPTSMLTRAKTGGDTNSYSIVLYFWLIAIGWLLLSLRPAFSRIVCAVVAGITLWAAFKREPTFYVNNGWLFPNKTRLETRAADYVRKHPGVVYFPWNPLVSLKGEGKLYHALVGIYDRNLAKKPLSRQQWEEGYPSDLRIVAYPTVHAIRLVDSSYLRNYSKQVQIAGLGGWTTYIDGP